MKNVFRKTEKSGRSGLLDSLRGLTVLNMVLYHGLWDLHYIYDVSIPGFEGVGAYIWQQILCSIFILLSGFCAAMGRRTMQRGGMLLALSMGIMVITALFMPESRIVFGVLTLLGSCMLFAGALKDVLLKIPAGIGVFINIGLFVFTKPINNGWLGVFSKRLIPVPEWFYQNHLTAYLGFPHKDFFSTDYFSLMPWMFLFFGGFYLYQLIGKRVLTVPWKGISALNAVGRYSLEIYVVHQPIIYGILALWMDLA